MTIARDCHLFGSGGMGSNSINSTVTTFIQTCSTDLCNTGDGRSPGTINAAKSVTTTAGA